MPVHTLTRAYDREAANGRMPLFGYARTAADFCIVLRSNGTVAFDPIDLRLPVPKKKEPVAPKLHLPATLAQRTSGVRSNFLWDKSAYVLGLTAEKAAQKEHAEFVRYHEDVLSDATDVGLLALKKFVGSWNPLLFTSLRWPSEILDANIIFAMDNNYRDELLHERPAAMELWIKLLAREPSLLATCLVSGNTGRTLDSHPPIKGVAGAQSSGSFIVSYNEQAYRSYGHGGGDNAPVSETAAFAYTTALNRFLERGSGHRIQIGDASTVFWADASSPEMAGEAESIFAQMVDPATDDKAATDRIASKLEQIRAGMPLRDIEPELEGVRFYVLGLAPNAARLSIRFYFEDSFGVLTVNYQRYLRDMKFRPWPEGRKLSIAGCVLRTAPARIEKGGMKFDREDISPLLAGELLRAVLSGTRFPGALLAQLLLRVRSDHVLDSIRIALIKGVITRSIRLDGRRPATPEGTPMEDYLVQSDPNDPNPARRLGRLFAVIERAQLAALGDDINATVKDKFLSAAAATPEQVFVGILKNAANHTKRLRNGHSDASWIKDATHARRVGAALSRDIGKLWGSFNDGVPKQHSVEEQGLFLVGYYQERYGAKSDATESGASVVEAETNVEGAE